jgi:hypothetical protein
VNKNAPKSEDPDRYFAPASSPSNTDYRHARSRSPISIGPQFSQPAQIPSIRNEQVLGGEGPIQAIRNIVVVGVCSSGKSTLVSALCDRGYHASAVSQEHSYVPHLWQRSNPDVLVYLDASIHTIRGRGRTRWRQSLLDEEHRRLQHAREHCHIYIPTDGLSPQDVVSRVVTFLRSTEYRVPSTE